MERERHDCAADDRNLAPQGLGGRKRGGRALLLTPEENMYADVLDLLLGEFESEFGFAQAWPGR